MDYQTLFETGELTPRQLRAWMAEDPVNAGRALRQRPALMDGLREILSSESTDPEVNRPVSAFDQIGDMREDIFGVDADDSVITKVAKGLGDAVVSPLALGAAGADYIKAGFNKLTGNEDGLQMEDAPGLGDVAGDAFNTGLAALTGGAGNVVKAGVGNLAKNGVKNTLGKVKNKVLNSPTGKLLVGGPKRQLATGVGVASAFGGGEDGTEDMVDLADKAPQTGSDKLTNADLDKPIMNPVTGEQSPMTLDNPMAVPANEMSGGFEGPMNAARSMGKLDPRDKSLQGFGEEVAQKNLVAEGNRRLKRDTQKAKADDRVAAIDDHTQRVLAERAALQRRAKLAREMFGAPFDSSVHAKKKRMQELANTGSFYVDPKDPENKNKAPGQVSRDEYMKRSGLTNPGTTVIENPDGSFSTTEFGDAFERAGGQASANNVLNPVQQAALGRQLDAESEVYTDEFGQQTAVPKDTVRMSGNMQDYGDATFATKEDALAYLNRDKAAPSQPDAPAEPAEPMAPESDEDEGLDWKDYALGAGALGTGALLARTPMGKKLIQKGLGMFGKNKQQPSLSNPWTTAANSTRQVRSMQGPAPLAPMQGPPAPQYLSNPYRSTRNMRPEYRGKTPQDLAPIKPMQGPAPLGPSQGPPMPQSLMNPYRSTRNMKPEYRGGTPEAPRPTLDAPTNPMSSTASMRRPVRTPQDVGMDDAISAMDRPSLIKAAGGARNVSGKMATDEELRRLARLRAQGRL